MTTLELRCNKCGAGLAVPDGTRYLKCEFCGASLEVKREGGATFTALAARIDKLDSDLKVIKLQNELERIDREWDERRAGLMSRGKDGQLEVPNRTASWVAGILAVGFGIFWTTMTVSNEAPAFFPVFGVAFITLAGVSVYRGHHAAIAYERALAEYRAQRTRIEAELAEAS